MGEKRPAEFVPSVVDRQRFVARTPPHPHRARNLRRSAKSLSKNTGILNIGTGFRCTPTTALHVYYVGRHSRVSDANKQSPLAFFFDAAMFPRR